jgi:hypothetical protein
LLWRKEDVFREAWNRNIEVVPVVFLEVPNEINAVNKATFYGLPYVFPSWRIASEGQNIATPMLFSGLGKKKYLTP